MTDPVAALRDINSRIELAAKGAGRDPAAVTLVAVSKTYGEEALLPVLQTGHRVFGENRIQEAKSKAIHSVDRMKIAEAIAAEMAKQQRRLKLFIQVNTGEEPQKAGIAPREAAAFISCCRDQLKLEIAGLMCIPPVDEEPALHFGLLAKLATENGLAGLSMGMSDDFETAIALGATHVRVGSAIFGARA